MPYIYNNSMDFVRLTVSYGDEKIGVQREMGCPFHYLFVES